MGENYIIKRVIVVHHKWNGMIRPFKLDYEHRGARTCTATLIPWIAAWAFQGLSVLLYNLENWYDRRRRGSIDDRGSTICKFREKGLGGGERELSKRKHWTRTDCLSRFARFASPKITGCDCCQFTLFPVTTIKWWNENRFDLALLIFVISFRNIFAQLPHFFFK